MCGLSALVRLRGSAAISPQVLERMSLTLRMRGPDDDGMWIGDHAGLAARRLAVIDTSAAGHMPMTTPDGRYHIVYNGEVYNHRELRRGLEAKGVRLRSDTDTEVFLHLYAREGPAMLSRCNGMFAALIWDDRERTLFAVRDRLGKKPIFYAEHRGLLHLASEPKALFAAGVPAAFDESTWPELLWFRHVAGAATPYVGVRRLLPGHYLVVRDGRMTSHRWWSFPSAGEDHRRGTSSEAAAEELRALLDDAVALRRVSDVPLGTFLSGGLDSSAVSALLARQSDEPVPSFTVRFPGSAMDEGAWARQVADRHQLDHREVDLLDRDVPRLLETATRLRDEPLPHAACLPRYALAEFAAGEVTVALTGEGSDEIFGGYERYRFYRHPWALALAGRLSALAPAFRRVHRRLRETHLLEPDSTARVMAVTGEGRCRSLLGFRTPHARPAYRTELASAARASGARPVRQVMWFEQQTRLQTSLDGLDRFTMGVALECRAPFLDHRIVEWAARTPSALLFAGGAGKQVLVRALAADLPPAVLRRPKQGLTSPYLRYFREVPALRERVAAVSDHEIIESLDVPRSSVRRATRRFLAGDDVMAPIIWTLVAVTLWHDTCVRHRG